MSNGYQTVNGIMYNGQPPKEVGQYPYTITFSMSSLILAGCGKPKYLGDDVFEIPTMYGFEIIRLKAGEMIVVKEA